MALAKDSIDRTNPSCASVAFCAHVTMYLDALGIALELAFGGSANLPALRLSRLPFHVVFDLAFAETDRQALHSRRRRTAPSRLTE